MMNDDDNDDEEEELAPPYGSESSVPSSVENDASKSINFTNGVSFSSSSTKKKKLHHQISTTTSRCSSFNSTIFHHHHHQRSASLCFKAPPPPTPPPPHSSSWSWLWNSILERTKNSLRNKTWCSRSAVFIAMAAQGAEQDSVTPTLYRTRTTTNNNQLINGKRLKREELEKEVVMLQRLLSQEEKVHEILEAVHSRHDGSAISIPSFLPHKMKELLAELVVIEAEIARLEHQIGNLQGTLKHEHEQDESKKERAAFETKALHFISKAIKGDYYNLKEFGVRSNPPRSLFTDNQNENDESFIGGGKFSRQQTGRLLNQPPPSPFWDLRHPTPKLRQPEILPSKSPMKPRTRPLQPDDKTQKWDPNKLSESIMKCLVFIYIRLLRTSRVMELEKLGMVARATQLNSSMNSRSFRADTGLNSKSNAASQKESRQSDPYGVFDSEESIPRDIGPYKNLVRFTSSSLDPKCISSSSSITLFKKLRELMKHLQNVDLKPLTNQQKLAFWINMYNACVMHGFLQYGVPSTPEKLYALLNKATLNIGVNTIHAQAIEYFILRKPSSSANNKEIFWKGDKEAKEAMVRGLYGLESVDPNVTFALCCGTRSSPAVRIYTGDGVMAELEKSKLEYLQASIIVTSAKKIAFPELLLRNAVDFATDAGSLVEWVCHQLPTSGTLRKSMVDCFRGHGSGGQVSITVEKIPYEYEFQYLLAM